MSRIFLAVCFLKYLLFPSNFPRIEIFFTSLTIILELNGTFITLLFCKRPFCLSPIFKKYFPNEADSIMPLDVFPTKNEDFLTALK